MQIKGSSRKNDARSDAVYGSEFHWKVNIYE